MGIPVQMKARKHSRESGAGHGASRSSVSAMARICCSLCLLQVMSGVETLKAYIELTKPRITLLLLAVALASSTSPPRSSGRGASGGPGGRHGVSRRGHLRPERLPRARRRRAHAAHGKPSPSRPGDSPAQRPRLRDRPHVARRHPAHVFLGWVTGALAIFTFVSYDLVYTPLKRRTECTRPSARSPAPSLPARVVGGTRQPRRERVDPVRHPLPVAIPPFPRHRGDVQGRLRARGDQDPPRRGTAGKRRGGHDRGRGLPAPVHRRGPLLSALAGRVYLFGCLLIGTASSPSGCSSPCGEARRAHAPSCSPQSSTCRWCSLSWFWMSRAEVPVSVSPCRSS